MLSFKLLGCVLSISIICCIAFSATTEDDVKCLQGVKTSLSDPLGNLNLWSFSNTSVGFICHFVGVSCWDDRQNRLISLQLRDMSLAGEIPDALQYCQSLQTLDLSGNSLSGSIPTQICSWLPYLVTLNLSNNSLTGSIPADLGNCSYLNNLILSNNELSGNIPHQISSLNRLKKISVANNDLSGQILPFSDATIIQEDFAGNSGLCGGPLGKCGGLNKKKLAMIIVAGVLGAVASMLLQFGVWWRYLRSRRG